LVARVREKNKWKWKVGGKNLQNNASYILRALIILNKDAGSIDIDFLTGGTDLGHLFSVETENITNSIMAGLINVSRAKSFSFGSILDAERLLGNAVVKAFDDPSIQVTDSEVNGEYVRSLVIENKKFNREKGNAIKKILPELAKGKAADAATLKKLEKALNWFFEGLEKNVREEMQEKFQIDNLAELTQSPSYLDELGQLVEDVFNGKVPIMTGTRTIKLKLGLKPTANKPKRQATKRRVQAPKRQLKKPGRVPVVPPARRASKEKRQAFLNLSQIKLYVNSQLHDKMQEKMRGRRLHYQTGRLAHSAQVVNIQQTRKDTVALYYTYMKNPYATFAKGGSRHTAHRDVDNLITASVRSLAKEVIGNKFKTSIRGT